MAKCDNCGKEISFLGSFKACSVKGKTFCDSNCAKEYKSKLQQEKEERDRAEEKVIAERMKGTMCPFTQVKLGSTVGFGGVESGSYTWQHTECIKGLCAIYNEKDDCCLIKTIAKKLK